MISSISRLIKSIGRRVRRVRIRGALLGVGGGVGRRERFTLKKNSRQSFTVARIVGTIREGIIRGS